MGAPIHLPKLQPPAESAPPDLPIPRQGWHRHRPAGEGGTWPIFTSTVQGYRLTITELVDGSLSGSVSDEHRAWLLTHESTLQAWIAALQCLERPRLRKRRSAESRP